MFIYVVTHRNYILTFNFVGAYYMAKLPVQVTPEFPARIYIYTHTYTRARTRVCFIPHDVRKRQDQAENLANGTKGILL